MADDRLVQCLTSSIRPSCAHCCMDQSNSQLTGVLASPKLPFPFWGSSPPCSTIPRAKPNHPPKWFRSVQPFLYGSQMLCCTMHCQWGRKPTKLPFPLGISSPCRRRTKSRPQATCTKNAKDSTCGSGDILADRQMHTQTDTCTNRHVHHNTSQLLPWVK